MIDTKELRRLAQAASHPTTKGRWIRLFGERTVYDRMEDGCRGIPVVSTDKHPPSPSEAACLDFIAAANPAVINELLDRLEAAEQDAEEQARMNGMGASREAALMAKLEAAEKERDALLAKIAEMEKQEPVAFVDYKLGNCFRWAEYLGWQKIKDGARLYTLPGAQPAPSVPECPYPCGWKNLLTYAIKDGAYLARAINEGEPVTENARAVTMRMVLRLRDVLMALNNAAPEAKP